MRENRSRLQLLAHYLRFNLRAAMAYRTAFWIQVFGMVLNNAAFIVFWLIIYSRTDSINGYSFTQVMFLWSLVPLGFGLSEVLMGNWLYVSRIIEEGELDVYLLQPRNLALNLLTSRMNVSGWGDILYALVLFFVTQPISVGGLFLYLYCGILVCLVMTACNLAYQSLTFFLGRAGEIARLGFEGMLTFSTYPGSLFHGGVKWVLTTIMPVVWIAYLPAELFSRFSWTGLLRLTAIDLVIIGASLFFFYLGVRRYESGNRIGSRL